MLLGPGLLMRPSKGRAMNAPGVIQGNVSRAGDGIVSRAEGGLHGRTAREGIGVV